MILCSCNRITEDEVRQAALAGAATVDAAYAGLGCEAQCGCCLDYAQEIIDDERRGCAGGMASSAVSGRKRAHLRLVRQQAA
ncbi:MAG TPA: (2Fe-2S)-binding protein [Sphingomicrobium sp.]|nr:(2Fe-2S)-binding protein [Sphingomicrobium sp.]